MERCCNKPIEESYGTKIVSVHCHSSQGLSNQDQYYAAVNNISTDTYHIAVGWQVAIISSFVTLLLSSLGL